jgi:hypothetical protein
MAAYPFESTRQPQDVRPTLPPGKLWRSIPLQRRLEAAQAFWDDTDATEQHAEALVAIAQAMNFRVKTTRALPAEKRARYLASIATLPDAVAARALVSYHLLTKRPMMAAFLDAVGIGHDNGLITAEGLKAPDGDALAAAAKKLAAEYPREDVDLYFATLIAQDPETWNGLSSMREEAGEERPGQEVSPTSRADRS